MSYRHKKRGTTYDTVGVGTMQCDKPVADYDCVMVYVDQSNGKLWIRPIDEFYDGRFEEIGATSQQRPEVG